MVGKVQLAKQSTGNFKHIKETCFNCIHCVTVNIRVAVGENKFRAVLEATVVQHINKDVVPLSVCVCPCHNVSVSGPRYILVQWQHQLAARETSEIMFAVPPAAEMEVAAGSGTRCCRAAASRRSEVAYVVWQGSAWLLSCREARRTGWPIGVTAVLSMMSSLRSEPRMWMQCCKVTESSIQGKLKGQNQVQQIENRCRIWFSAWRVQF